MQVRVDAAAAAIGKSCSASLAGKVTHNPTVPRLYPDEGDNEVGDSDESEIVDRNGACMVCIIAEQKNLLRRLR